MKKRRRKSRKNVTTPTHRNLKMNDEVYALRRRVMGFVYEAKRLLDGDLPRIEIRITECTEPRVLGSARMGDCVVWIPAEKMKQRTDIQLRRTVLHEILHAVFAQEHVEGCKLMGFTAQPCGKREQDRLFLKYARENRTSNERSAA